MADAPATPDTPAPVVGRCDSCGRDDEVLTAVHRMYVRPESWDQQGEARVLEEIERWCFPCLTHYPHVLA
jgi:hypothetical protein